MVWSINNNSINEHLDNNSAQKQIINNQTLSSPKNKTPRFHNEELKRGPQEAPQKLSSAYNVESSLDEAFKKAVSFANRTLLDDELSMTMQINDSGEQKALVTNVETKDVVQEYSAMQVLQMYSNNYDLQGLVIDAVI